MKEFALNKDLSSPEYQKSDFLVQILAGGKGTRLASVTLGLAPKSLVEIAPNLTILDLTVQKVQSLGFTKIVYSLSLEKGCFGKEIYEHVKNKGYGLENVFENHNRGNAYSVK